MPRETSFHVEMVKRGETESQKLELEVQSEMLVYVVYRKGETPQKIMNQEWVMVVRRCLLCLSSYSGSLLFVCFKYTLFWFWSGETLSVGLGID